MYKEVTGIYQGVRALSSLAGDALSHLEDTITQLNGNVETVCSYVADMFTDVRLTADAVAHLQFLITAMYRTGTTRTGADGDRPDNAARSSNREIGPSGITESWHMYLTIAYLRITSTLDSLAINMLSSYRNLTSADLGTLRNGFTVIYAAAAVTASGSSENAWYAAIANPGVFLSAFLTALISYVAAFLCWKHIPRRLRESQADTIVIIDVLGFHMRLPLGKCTSWEDVHALPVDRFANKDGAEYVRARAYAIVDTAGEADIITPAKWGSLGAGMTFEMTVIVRQTSRVPRCPYCGLFAWQTLDVESFHCKRCKYQYRSTSTMMADAAEAANADIIHASDHPPNVIRSEPLSQNSTPNKQPRRTTDMKAFRRIMVTPLQQPQDGGRASRSKEIPVGARVAIKHIRARGIVRFNGQTQFGGKWIGVELSEPKGRNDGTVQAVVY